MKRIIACLVVGVCVFALFLTCGNAFGDIRADASENGSAAAATAATNTGESVGTDVSTMESDLRGVDTDGHSEIEQSKPPSVDADIFAQALCELKVREASSTSGKVLGALNPGDTLGYYETVGNWHKILYNNKIAYISANPIYSMLVDKTCTNDKVEGAIAVGLSLLGTPYEYGSTRVLNYNLSENANFTGKTFDCSAFVQYSYYAGADIKLNGDSRSMSRQGTEVMPSDIKRGDVIFMTSSARQYNTGIERIGHVVIYLGEGKILHTFGTGGVRVQEYSDFWQNRMIKISRMS